MQILANKKRLTGLPLWSSAGLGDQRGEAKSPDWPNDCTQVYQPYQSLVSLFQIEIQLHAHSDTHIDIFTSRIILVSFSMFWLYFIGNWHPFAHYYQSLPHSINDLTSPGCNRSMEYHQSMTMRRGNGNERWNQANKLQIKFIKSAKLAILQRTHKCCHQDCPPHDCQLGGNPEEGKSDIFFPL